MRSSIPLVLAVVVGPGCTPSKPEAEAAPAAKPESKAEPEAKAEPVPEPDAKVEAKAEAKAEPTAKPEPEPEPEPDPEPDTIASAPLPKLPFAEAGMTEKMDRRLRSKLRQTHQGRTEILEKVELAHPDGGLTVLALYGYSTFEACVAKEGGGKEARESCAQEVLFDSNERRLAERLDCLGHGLVRASFGPPKPSNPEYGGALTIDATVSLELGCKIVEPRTFEYVDVDGDDAPELAVDLVFATPQTEFRTAEVFEERNRHVAWYRSDLSDQLTLASTDWIDGDPMGTPVDVTVVRLDLADRNGDGRRDIVARYLEYMTSMCTVDARGWPADQAEFEARTREDEEDFDSEPCVGEVEEQVYAYSREEDTWIVPASPD